MSQYLCGTVRTEEVAQPFPHVFIGSILALHCMTIEKAHISELEQYHHAHFILERRKTSLEVRVGLNKNKNLLL